MAYPVVPPRDSPIPHTTIATRYGASPGAGPAAANVFDPIAAIASSRTAVAISSHRKLQNGLRTAGEVQNTASFAAGSGVSGQ